MLLRDLLGRIGARLALFLTLALLPLGLIAVWQTREVSERIEERSRLTLVALTQQAASTERRVIERSFGAAQALGSVVTGLLGDPAACSETMRAYLLTAPEHSFAGFVPPDGIVSCSNGAETFDISDVTGFDELMANPRRTVRVPQMGRVSGGPVITTYQPVYVDDGFIGYLAISTPRGVLEFNFQSIQPSAPISLVTFTIDGTIIAANGPLDSIQAQLPARRELAELAAQGAATLEAVDGRGGRHVYAVAPIVDDVAYAIGRWGEGDPATGAVNRVLPAYAFPIVMWLASLAVAYFAVHRVIIKHIRVLQSEMRAFALHRRLPPRSSDPSRPTELVEMHRTFERTASILLRDEADLENALHEQKVLLKEVHHRVKNNLQLISSIMSMQIRNVQTGEARVLLRRLQDRVLGLAAIHRNLYQSETLARVRVDDMLSEIFAQMRRTTMPPGSDVELRLEAEKVSLYPDQVVPLSLLAAESITNALKYVGRSSDGNALIEVGLREQDGDIVFTVFNTLGDPLEQGDVVSEPMQSDGLGGRLIRAFASQLAGDLSVSESERGHTLRLVFRPTPFSEISADAEAAA